MNKEIKILIIGTNNFDDYSFFEEKIYEVLEKYFEKEYKIFLREQEVNSTDNFVVRFSKENNCELERYKIDWDKFGKRAAYENIKRLIWGENSESGIDILCCFCNKWDGEKEKFMINKVIDEFKSIINFDSFYNQNLFLFKK